MNTREFRYVRPSYVAALAVALLAFVSNAHATEGHHPSHPPAARPSLTQTQGQAQAQKQGQSQGQSQNAAAKAAAEASASSSVSSANDNHNAVSTDNDQSTDVGQSVSVVNQAVRQAPPAEIALTNTTSSCFHPVSVSFSTPVGGVGFGKGRKSQDCFRMELVTALYARGQDAAGDRVLCTVTEIKQALGDDCLALVNELKPALASAPGVTEYVTKQELATRDANILKHTASK